jgi:hypothetical protein
MPDPDESTLDPSAALTAPAETPAGDAGDSGGADPVTTDPAVDTAVEEDAYDQAFADFLSEDAGGDQGEGESGGEGASEGSPAASSDAGPDGLSNDDVQLLRRQHLDPEAFKALPAEARQKFLDNARKREADNTRTYQQLKEENERLRAGKPAEGDGDQEADDGERSQERQEAPAGELSQDDQQMVETIVDTYGEELRPLAEANARSQAEVRELRQQLDQSRQAMSTQARLTIDHIADTTLDGLESDYPSLSKPEARQKVLERFRKDWDPNSQDESQSLAQRLRSGIKDAARVTFSNSERAAQVAHRNRNRSRLASQPSNGSARRAPAPQNEDEVYDRAFANTLGQEMR